MAELKISLEELTARQSTTGQEIQQLLSNYRKDSSSRKTNEYLNSRLELLERLWSNFASVDLKLQPLAEHFPENPYFTKNYFDVLKREYDKVKDDIERRLLTSVGLPQTDASTTEEAKRLHALVRQQKAKIRAVQRIIEGIDASKIQSRQFYDFKIEAVSKYWDDIRQGHDELWRSSTDPAQYDYKESEYFDIEESIQVSLIYMRDCLAKLTGSSTETSRVQSHVNLPHIVAPVFSGDYAEWQSFYDLFRQMIHEQPLGNAQKLWYLKSNLRGEAERLIRHLAITDDNYNTAWEILKHRYQNQRLMVFTLLEKLLSQPVITTETAGSLKKLYDATRGCLLGLQNLQVDTSTWDPILLFILLKKLDKTSHALYEQNLKSPRDLPTVEEFLTFLEHRFQSLESLGLERQPSASFKSGLRKTSALVSTNSNIAVQCKMCHGAHRVHICPEFLKLSIPERINKIRQLKLCLNCLREGHQTTQCTSRNCLRCPKRHNTLLHLDDSTQSLVATTPKSTPKGEKLSPATARAIETANTSVTLSTETAGERSTLVLLSTAIIKVPNHRGQLMELRAVLDSGSQINIITENAANQLGLPKKRHNLYIRGLGGVSQQTQQSLQMPIQSTRSSFTKKIEAVILPRITAPQPTRNLDVGNWNIPKGMQLADPHFNRQDRIDLLLGADIYYELLTIGQIRLNKGLPLLQNTVLGWIVAGKVDPYKTRQVTCGIFSTDDSNLNKQVERFWQLEESEGNTSSMTAQELCCEADFAQHTRRTPDGRFEVKLPFKQSPQKLGASQQIATQRFLQLERKLIKNDDLYNQYRQFMCEYEGLGHMTEIDPKTIPPTHCFLPHHGVLKPQSTTTKLRVVFDASARTESGYSLNELLHTGPTIQPELFTILLRFRLPCYVFTADIEKMYRQVTIAESDRWYQLIVWRNHPSESLKYYKLNTVTYGTTIAPYLATKALKQLADQTSLEYPLSAGALKHDFYMDDVMTGSDSLSLAIEKQKQLLSVLSSAGFKLRKWCANNKALLENIPVEHRELQLNLAGEIEGQVKTLGLLWLPNKDEFQISTSSSESGKITKRSVLSDIARVFDPLGLMSPVTVKAKIFLQQLWSLKLNWDDTLPPVLHTEWLNFRTGLQELDQIRISRHVFGGNKPKVKELHVFADASEKAYGASVYARAEQAHGIRTVQLLCAKSRVAPLKLVTLPRLELCAAKLAAELAHRVKQDLCISNLVCFYWTDSEIVLNWIYSDASSFHTFVANHVATIQKLSEPSQWRHVDSKQNPADIISRGIAPEKLRNYTLWFYGPIFLHGPQICWPGPFSNKDTDLEKKRQKVVLAAIKDSTHFIHQIDHRNSMRRLQTIVAYVARFVKKLRTPSSRDRSSDTIGESSSVTLCPGPSLRRARNTNTHYCHAELSVEELDNAFQIIVREAQSNEFYNTIRQLKATRQTDERDPLVSLRPIIDPVGLLRVGGRIEDAALPYDTRHQIILPYGHYVTKLIVHEYHIKHLHAGGTALLAILRQRFWPIKGKTTVRAVVNNCIRCAKAKPKLLTQLMGNLPVERVQPNRPFINAGVDFAGPLWTHFKTRGKRPQKTYIAIFCCFSTKAIHIEVVSDLTTEAFIGALKRFTGRRGHCRKLFCDNATNFVGARNQLAPLSEVIHTARATKQITRFCTTKGIDFKFIPPRSPHFGGLWEAAVKSAKYFIVRNIAPASLTYEELETVMIEIEAILNSRPLTSLSADANDLNALTPGHFLIGEPLTNTVDARCPASSTTLSKRWKELYELKQRFWQRWSSEYLTELQQRVKWTKVCKNIQPGMLVVIKEDNLPALKWRMGRILRGIPGADGLIRVADVKTSSGVLRRAIHSLAPLPVQAEEDQDQVNKQPNLAPRAVKHKMTEPETSLEPRSKQSSRGGGSRRWQMMSAPINLLLWASLVVPVFTSLAHISSFPQSPRLYFESLGPANLVLSEWDIVVYYNLTSYWQEAINLRQAVSELQDEICRQPHNDKFCTTLVSQFNALLANIEQSNELLQPSTRKKMRRNKRGALNVVGSIANSLFGLLDDDYAKRMESVITSVKNNDEHVLQLIKNQTSIIDSTVNIMMGIDKSTNHALSQLNSTLNSTILRLNQIARLSNEHEAYKALYSMTMQLMVSINNYQNTQTALLDVLTDTHHGKINPRLITPEQLSQELSSIKEELPSHLRLPTKPSNLLGLYSIMTIEGRVTDKNLIFRLKLPLFSEEAFELLHLVSIPAVINDTVMAIQTNLQYLITSLNRDQYYPMNEQELSTCRRGINFNFICKQLHPLYRIGSTTNACEMSFISHISSDSKCMTAEAINAPRWTQLITPNHWIYFMKQPTSINVICGGSLVQSTLDGSGIIQIGENCAIKEKFVTIQAHKLFPSSFNTSFVPTRNITDFKLAPPEPELKNTVTSSYSFMTNLEELKDEIYKLRRQEVLSNSLAPKDVHHFTIGYVGLFGSLMIILYLLWRHNRNKGRNGQPEVPIPRPRTHLNPTIAEPFSVSIDG